MAKQTEFRVFGPELGEKDTFIDVTISGIDEDGSIYLYDQNGGREFSLSSGEITALFDDNLMLDITDVKTHSLWKVAEDLGGEREFNIEAPFADSNVEEAQRHIFLAAFEETR